jgi:hypothetical protein
VLVVNNSFKQSQRKISKHFGFAFFPFIITFCKVPSSKTGIDGFDIASGKLKGKHYGRIGSDLNVYKIIEGSVLF